MKKLKKNQMITGIKFLGESADGTSYWWQFHTDNPDGIEVVAYKIPKGVTVSAPEPGVEYTMPSTFQEYNPTSHANDYIYPPVNGSGSYGGNFTINNYVSGSASTMLGVATDNAAPGVADKVKDNFATVLGAMGYATSLQGMTHSTLSMVAHSAVGLDPSGVAIIERSNRVVGVVSFAVGSATVLHAISDGQITNDDMLEASLLLVGGASLFLAGPAGFLIGGILFAWGTYNYFNGDAHDDPINP